jgi:hypothetical protein
MDIAELNRLVQEKQRIELRLRQVRKGVVDAEGFSEQELERRFSQLQSQLSHF